MLSLKEEEPRVIDVLGITVGTGIVGFLLACVARVVYDHLFACVSFVLAIAAISTYFYLIFWAQAAIHHYLFSNKRNLFFSLLSTALGLALYPVIFVLSFGVILGDHEGTMRGSFYSEKRC